MSGGSFRGTLSLGGLLGHGFLGLVLTRVTAHPGERDYIHLNSYLLSPFYRRQSQQELTRSHLNAWMMTVPNRMNRAEKIRDRIGIISLLTKCRC